MSKRAIIWTGPDRQIPPYGTVNPGDVRDDLPEHVAQSFVEQKLAEWQPSPTVKRKKEQIDG